MLARIALTLRQIFAGRRLWLIAIFLSLPVGLSTLVRYGEGFVRGNKDAATAIYLFVVYPGVASVLLSLLYGSGLLSAEIEQKTVTYLFTRPLARWRILTGSYAGTCLVLVPSAWLSFAVSWLVLGAPGGTALVLGFLVAIAQAILAYTAIFCLIGIFAPRRAMTFGLIYVLVLEVGLSLLPVLVNRATVCHYTVAIVARMSKIQIPPDLREILELPELSASISALALIAVAALAAGCVVATRKECHPIEQV